MNPTLAERAQRYLLASKEEMDAAHLPLPVQQRLLRMREMYALWLQNPRYVDRDIVRHLQDKYQISLSQAYEDVRCIKICLGNLGRLTRDYDRYLFRLRCEEGWQMARDHDDPRAFAAITSTYLKGTGLDQPDTATPDYSQIKPQQFIISPDPSVAGFKVVPGILEKARRLEQRYIQEIREEETATLEADPPSPTDISPKKA